VGQKRYIYGKAAGGQPPPPPVALSNLTILAVFLYAFCFI